MTRKKTKDATEPEPMDASAPEVRNPVPAVTASRTAYAIETLVSEVLSLFPETPHEFTNVNGRGVSLGVVFDSTTLDGDDRTNFEALLMSVNVDERVAEVVNESNAVLVRVHNRASTQDTRDSFDLDDIYLSLGEEVEGFAGPITDATLLTDEDDTPAERRALVTDFDLGVEGSL